MDALKRVVIYYFSGTGNAELIAETFRTGFQSAGAVCDTVRMEDVLHGKVKAEPEKYDFIGLGYCIHALNAPRIVFDFVRSLPPGAGLSAFLFKCPGDAFMRGGSTSQLRGRMKGRGYKVIHESLFVTPANVGFRIGDALVKKLYEVARERAGLAVREMLSGKTVLQDNTLTQRIITSVFSAGESVGARFYGRSLLASNKCVSCGLCAARCPARNIAMDSGRPKFGWRCLMCLRCIYGCPEKAIGSWFGGAGLIGDYRASKEILGDGASDKPPTYHPLLTSGCRDYVEGRLRI